jgi:hypothetical protein
VWDEGSGELHRELKRSPDFRVIALATYSLRADGQPRLVAWSSLGHLRVYDPEGGLMLHDLTSRPAVDHLACIASSSAAPHHPRLVATTLDGTIVVWDGETGERLADLREPERPVTCVAAWKEHTGGHDRIAAADRDSKVTVYDGETFTVLHDIDIGARIGRLLAFESAEGPARLLVQLDLGWGLPAARRHQPRLSADKLPPVRVGTGPPPPGHHRARQTPSSAPRPHDEGLPRRVGPGGGPCPGRSPAAGKPPGLRLGDLEARCGRVLPGQK